jgi:hypothetical protein
MSLVAIQKNINKVKKEIDELKMTNMHLELEDNKILELENSLSELEKIFQLQKEVNKKNNKKNNNKNKNNNNVNIFETFHILDTSESNSNFTNDKIKDDELEFPDNFTIAKQQQINNFNNLMSFREEKRKMKNILLNSSN